MPKFAIPLAPHARVEVIALLAALMAMNAISVDVILAALPGITTALRASSENQQQFVILVYMVGLGAAQFFYGPILDRFGRRPPLIVGMLIYSASAILCIFAPNMVTLLLLRFMQGVGAAATRVGAQAITRDLFKGRAMAEVMSLVQMVFMAVPIVAPAIGQGVLLFSNWHGVFWLMALFGLAVLVWTYVRLPETLAPQNRRHLSFAVISEGFGLVFSNRIAMGYMIASAFLYGGILAFVSMAQQVYVDIYHLGPLFPLAFAASAVTMALSSYINSRIVGRFGMRRISHFAVFLTIASSGVLTAIGLFGTPPLWVFIIMIAVPIFSIAMTMGNMISLAMEPLGKVAGSASAVFGSIQVLGGAALGIITGQMFNGTIIPVTGGWFVFALCALVAVLLAENGKLFGVGNQSEE